MCGKHNPSDRETCQHCEARIKPKYSDLNDEELSKLLGLDGSSSSEPLSEEPYFENSSDWLAALEEKSLRLSFQKDNPDEDEAETTQDDSQTEDGNKLPWGDTSENFKDDVQEEDHQNQSDVALPGWLEAMKPVDSFFSESDDMEADSIAVEGAGPLAGLRGVIAAEPDISFSRKPTIFSGKLRVTEQQQAHVALLEQLIQSEGKSTPISRRENPIPARLSRLLLACLLTLLILFVFFAPEFTQVNPPDLANYPSIWAAYQQIEQVGLDKPVLLAIDYQPGVSGEVEAITNVLLKHLISKNAKLTFVSTQPMGPMLAEKVISRSIHEMGISYLTGRDYFNLGFIPGGSSGLLSFISHPQQIFPFSVDGENVWETPVLKDIHDVNNFSVIIVATEDADIARFWIEQLTAYQAIPSILMAVSAQIEPIVAPYFQGSPLQIQGIISGLSGAAAYEGVSFIPRDAIKEYSAFSLAGFVAVLFIVFGSAVSFLSSFYSTHHEHAKDLGGEK